MYDKFLLQKNCDRCGAKLSIRTMSWFTEDVICLDCSKKETEIKKALRNKGDLKSYEGCGYIPIP